MWLTEMAVQRLLLRCFLIPGFPNGNDVKTEAEACKFSLGRIGCGEKKMIPFL